MKRHTYLLTKNSVLYYSDNMEEKIKNMLEKKEASVKENYVEVNLIRGEKI